MSVVIEYDAGVEVASGVTGASYTLEAKYEGVHTWHITAMDKVGHKSTKIITTKYDITGPGIEGTETTFVTPDGTTVSGYCQNNIISQHIDDEASRSANSPNATAGLKAVSLYSVKGYTKTLIATDTTKKTWAAPDTHSSFDVYYEIQPTETDVDYYLLVVSDYAGNIVQKRLTSQYSLLSCFHTSIDRSSYR